MTTRSGERDGRKVGVVGVGAVGQACAFVTIGLPTVVGRDGAAGELEPAMSEDERRAFDRSAATLREAARRTGVRSR